MHHPCDEQVVSQRGGADDARHCGKAHASMVADLSKITKRGVSVIQRTFLLSFLGIVALLSLLRLAESAPRLRACCTVKRAALIDQTASASVVRYARCDRRRALAAHPTTPHHEYRRAPVARRAPQRRRPVLRCRQPAGGAERTARRPHSSATGGR